MKEENTPYERMERERWMLITVPDKVKAAMEKNVSFFLPHDTALFLKF